jgi:hypothetical protein
MAQRKIGAAEMGVTVGTTYDVEYRSDRVGHVEMLVMAPAFEGLIMQPLDFVAPKQLVAIWALQRLASKREISSNEGQWLWNQPLDCRVGKVKPHNPHVRQAHWPGLRKLLQKRLPIAG